MALRGLDGELKAMATIAKVLDELSLDEQTRVTDWINTRLRHKRLGDAKVMPAAQPPEGLKSYASLRDVPVSPRYQPEGE